MTRSGILLLALAACSGIAAYSAAPAHAGNGDEAAALARYHSTSCRYGDPRRCAPQPCHPCRDCQMSWQPIRSIMHPNMMPAGMIRPFPPLNRKLQNLLPKVPVKWLRENAPWCGCRDARCLAP